jgi:hypothetical protein
VFAVVLRVQARDDDAGLLGVNEIVPSDVDADMRQAALERVLEEDEIAGSPFATSDRTPAVALLLNAAADVHVGGFLVDIPGEPRAVEPLLLRPITRA